MTDWRMPEPTGLTKPEIHKIAEEVAGALRYSVGNDLEPIVIDLNGEVNFQDFWKLSESNDGSIEVEPSGQFKVYVSNYVSELRNRFTIAHELGHYFLHYLFQRGHVEKWAFRAKRYTNAKHDRSEWEANWFAAAFLMPTEQFKKDWDDFGGDLEQISRKYRVSVSAVALHAEYHKCQNPNKP